VVFIGYIINSNDSTREKIKTKDMNNNEQLKFAALYLESAQIKMEFEDSTQNYTSMVSPTQLEVIKYGYQLINGSNYVLKSATLILKDLKEITDEHATETSKIEGYSPNGKIERLIAAWDKDLVMANVYLYGRSYSPENILTINSLGYIEWDNNESYEDHRTHGVSARAYDYLRSKAYLLPFGAKTIEEILKLNWVEYELR